MTTSVTILLVLAVVVIVGLLLAANRGPRVTQITRTIEHDDEKDGGDA